MNYDIECKHLRAAVHGRVPGMEFGSESVYAYENEAFEPSKGPGFRGEGSERMYGNLDLLGR